MRFSLRTLVLVMLLAGPALACVWHLGAVWLEWRNAQLAKLSAPPPPLTTPNSMLVTDVLPPELQGKGQLLPRVEVRPEQMLLEGSDAVPMHN